MQTVVGLGRFCFLVVLTWTNFLIFFDLFLHGRSGDGISDLNSICIFSPSMLINSSHPLGSNCLGTLHKGGAFDFVIRESSS